MVCMYQQLFPPQQEVLDHGILDLGFSAVLSLATGSGKTTLAELGIEKALARNERAIYLTPLKALAEEKIEAWKDKWPTHRVGIFTGDYESASLPTTYRDAQILICTYERLDGILRHWQRHLSWLSQVGLVVVDELHLLMDPSRGSRLEGSISRLQRVNPFARVLGLSATISNHEEVADWLNGVSFHSDWRPVALKHEIRRFARIADKPEIIIDIVAETHADDAQTLVFVSSRRRAEQLAKQIDSAGYPAAHHHAGLTMVYRRKVESEFRTGALTCLLATPTLEMGLNLPCRTIVIADNTRWNGETFQTLPVWNYLQRAGRAGRPGQDGEGRAILLAPKWAKNIPNYGNAQPEPVRSHLSKPSALAEQILIEVASRSCRTRQQLVGAFLPSTLAGKQGYDSKDRMDACLNDLVSAGLLSEDEHALLHPTKVGWAAVRHQLSPATAKHLLALNADNDSQQLSDFDLLLHHCWDADLRPQLPLSIEVIEVLEEMVQAIPSRLLDAPPPHTLQPKQSATGVLMACIAWTYIQAGDVQEVCERLDIYPSDADTLRENLVRLLNASADLQAAVHAIADPAVQTEVEDLYGPSLSNRIRQLSLRLAHGLPGDSVDLTRIPGCGGKFARKLVDAQIYDLEDLCNQDPVELAKIPGIGLRRAQAWIEAAEHLIKTIEPHLWCPAPPRLRSTALPNNWPLEIEPGRLRRACSLHVQKSKDCYWVSGGAEEHLVQGDACDCADFAQHGSGWWCKHRLAVQIYKKDRKISALVSRMSELEVPPTLAGHLADLALGQRWHHV